MVTAQHYKVRIVRNLAGQIGVANYGQLLYRHRVYRRPIRRSDLSTLNSFTRGNNRHCLVGFFKPGADASLERIAIAALLRYRCYSS